MESKGATLTSDDEEEQDCMPKILNTVSLQGCSGLGFTEDTDNALYPECEIKEEKEGNEDIKQEPIENGLSHRSGSKEDKNKSQKKKKRVELKHLQNNQGQPSTSRREDHNVVDAKRLALQESLFKTKELFDTFLRVCQDQENTEQMEKAVQKLCRTYDATRQEYLGSQSFQNILEAETEKVNTSNTKPWINMKLVLDELKYNKKNSANKLKLGESEESQDAGGSNDDEPIIECPKKRRHLKKLEKTLRAINLKIKKLEEKEVDWDEEDNSAYCKLDRYRAQFTKIYTKICEIKGKLPDADRPYLRKVSFAGTTYPHINRCIEKYYNKHREFPDFQDIKKLVVMANKSEGIEMPPIKIHSMAAAAFKEFGEMLKRLRQYDDYDVLVSYLDQQVDPARDDEQLQEQLARNAVLFKKQEKEVIDKFVEKAAQVGVSSESGDNSDSKPKKKSKKITFKDPSLKNKSPSRSSLKRNLSNGESSDDEVSKVESKVGLSRDSDNSGSDSEDTGKKRSVKNKGKALVGKPRIVKKGVRKTSPEKSHKPNTAMSSDEETPPGNSKESLTNYLGLQGTSSLKSSETKESNKMSESEDEIAYIDEIQCRTKKNTSSGNKSVVRSKARVELDTDIKSENSHSSKSSSSDSKEAQNRSKSVADSDSDIEPIAIVNRPTPRSATNKKKPSNQARKSTGPRTHNVVGKKPIVEIHKNTHETISDSSESESRTSDEDSESEAEKRILSDVELSSGSKDSSDEEIEMNKEEDADDTIVVLSEDILEEPKLPVPKNSVSKPQDESSDSDEICILSQIETERRTVAPRKIKPNSVTATLVGTARKTGVATSTPIKAAIPPMKRKLSNQCNNGNSAKARKLDVPTNRNGKQTTLPQIINGAARKVIVRRVSKTKSSSSSSTPEHIPLIELD